MNKKENNQELFSEKIAASNIQESLHDNPIIHRAMRKLKESTEKDNHVSHWTKHSSHSTRHSSSW